MADRQPPSAEDEPNDVADCRRDAGVGSLDDRLAERPERERRDPQRRDAERNRDDQNEADERCDGVCDRHPYARQDKPDDVEDQPHALAVSGSGYPRARLRSMKSLTFASRRTWRTGLGTSERCASWMISGSTR